MERDGHIYFGQDELGLAAEAADRGLAERRPDRKPLQEVKAELARLP